MRILSRERIREVLQNEPGIHDAIIIHEVGDGNSVSDLPALCKSYLLLEFNDYNTGENSPKKEQVIKALEWAKDKGPLLVACQAGISRSSAIAYSIEYTRVEDKRDALRILDPWIHYPNKLIISHASTVLGDEFHGSLAKHYEKAKDCWYEDQGYYDEYMSRA